MVLSGARKATCPQRLYTMYGFIATKWTRRGKSRRDGNGEQFLQQEDTGNLLGQWPPTPVETLQFTELSRVSPGWAWHTLVTSALRRLKQEGYEFENDLS